MKIFFPSWLWKCKKIGELLENSHLVCDSIYISPMWHVNINARSYISGIIVDVYHQQLLSKTFVFLAFLFPFLYKMHDDYEKSNLPSQSKYFANVNEDHKVLCSETQMQFWRRPQGNSRGSIYLPPPFTNLHTFFWRLLFSIWKICMIFIPLDSTSHEHFLFGRCIKHFFFLSFKQVSSFSLSARTKEKLLSLIGGRF